MSSPPTFGRHPTVIFQDVIDLSNRRKEEQKRSAPPRPLLPIYIHPSNWPLELPSGSVTQEILEEGYGSVISRTVVEECLRRWDPKSDVTAELGDYLVRTFLPFRGDMLFHVNVPAFLQRVYLPPYSPRAIHPALLYVIFLIACQVGGGKMVEFEPIFLARTRAHLYEPVANQDRLTQLIWARIILAAYFARCGSASEANHTAWLAGKLAAEMGLHRGAANNAQTAQAISSHEIECDIPDCLWYAASLMTTIAATYTGLPSSVPEQSITTLEVLFWNRPSEASNNDVLLLKTKVFTLFRAIRQLTTHSPSESQISETICQSAQYYRSQIIDAHATLLDTFPPLEDSIGIEALEKYSLCNPHLTWIYFVYHACTISLYNSLVELDPQALKKTVDAAYAMSHLAKRLRPSGSLLPLHGPLIIMVRDIPVTLLLQSIEFAYIVHTKIPIYCGCETLALELHRNRMRETPDEILNCARAEEALSVMLDTLLDLTHAYPIRLRGFRKLATILCDYQVCRERDQETQISISNLF